MTKQIILVVYSGGMDSFTVLHRALEIANDQPSKIGVRAITFDYGQRHFREVHFALRECSFLDIPHTIVNLDSAKHVMRGSALTSPDISVPEGHYEAENMRQTVVPGRNTVMLALALAHAESIMLSEDDISGVDIHYGAHSGDHHIYPDCRPYYVECMSRVIHAASDGLVRLDAPYLMGNKETILKDGFAMGLDYGRTWTCYNGGKRPCGKCGACVERRQAFAAVGRVDPWFPPSPG